MCGITENGTIGLVDSRPKEVMWHSLAASDCPRLSKTRPRRNLQHEHCAIKFNDVMSCCIIFFHYFIYNKTDEMMFLRTLIFSFSPLQHVQCVINCLLLSHDLLMTTHQDWCDVGSTFTASRKTFSAILLFPCSCNTMPYNKIDFLYQLILQIKRCLTHN